MDGAQGEDDVGARRISALDVDRAMVDGRHERVVGEAEADVAVVRAERLASSMVRNDIMSVAGLSGGREGSCVGERAAHRPIACRIVIVDE